MEDSVKIKRYRKKKFTKHRNPYKAYNNADWHWKDIFCEINEAKNNNDSNYLKLISSKYGINYNTLRNKYYKWNAQKINNIDKENRGGSNKVFTDKEEHEIFIYLKENYIDKFLPLCNDDIKTIAKNKYESLKRNKTKKFNASNGWCSYFKKRWKLVSVTPKISRVSTHVYTDDEINEFINDCIDSIDEVGKFFFLI